MPHTLTSPSAAAAQFVDARLRAAALDGYPGPTPADLATAYAVQDAAIALWPDEVAGWKIGLIAQEHRAAYGQDRIAGPIFQKQTQIARGDSIELPVFTGGFAAVEAEFVIVVGRDQPVRETPWTEEDVAPYAGAMHVGVELAGSPLSAINDLGPAVTASDFGNNAGLVIGPEVKNWRTTPLSDLVAETSIDGTVVGTGSAALIPGGPLAALAFIFGHCARRGKLLRKGQYISTGATTGVHRIEAGQTARLAFGGYGQVICRTVAAGPQALKR